MGRVHDPQKLGEQVMNQTRIATSSYICDLVIAICAIITGIMQLRQVRIAWLVHTESGEDNVRDNDN